MPTISPIAIARRAALRALSIVPISAGLRARFLLEKSRIDAGLPVTTGDLVPALLRRADAAHAAGHDQEAIDWLDKAQQITFHPSICTADRMVARIAPWRDSVAGRLLLSDPDEPARRPPPSKVSKVLVLTGGSSIFIDRVTDALTPALQGEIRTMAFTDLLSPDERPTRRAVLEMRYALSTTGRRTPAPPALAQQLDWADVVLVEWASLEFAWFSLLDRPQVRTIVRLHRYEAMTLYPQLADMARIDAVLFIAEHVANLVRGTAPRLAAVPWTGVIPNLHDLSAFRTKKKEGASRTLVQVVWDRAVKDVGYALDVLEVVRREDPSWKLMLVGRTAEETAPGSSYAKESMARISEFGDAVEILGRRDDIPEVLTGAGFLISSSLHEGSHESVAEGAAAGCVPVVRNWPQAQPWGGAYGQYPTSWIVEGPTDAAARILSIAESARSSAEGSEAHTWILAARDRAAITRRYRDLVLHPPRES